MPEPRWYEKSYRRNLVDMHIDDWQAEFLSQLDPRTYVELLKRANVQSAMVYANSHVGLCYWPTKIGRMHGGIGGRDVLGEIIDLCHQDGIDVIPYYSLIFNNWAYDANPSWRTLDHDGKGSRDRGGRAGRYGTCCPNCQGYRDFAESQIAELCSGYDFEGIFFDMTFWPSICYCPSCRERFSKEVGGEMPAVIDWQDPRWLAFQRKREEWLVEFAAFATTAAKSRKPGVSVEHNSAVLTASWQLATTLGLAGQNDYIGGDMYGGFAEQSFICKLYDSVTPNKPFEYMTSRCYPNLRDHTTLKPREMLELHTYLALAHNGAFLFIDAIDPLGTLNPTIYDTMGAVFGESKKYEPFLGGQRCQDVAVYVSLDSKMDFADNGKQVLAGGFRTPHVSAALGAARTLRENHIPFGVISRDNLKDTSAYQVIVLPNLVMLSEEEAEILREFVAEGGSLYASGLSSPPLRLDVFGIAPEGETKEAVTYMTPNSRGRDLFPGVEGDYPLSISERQTKARAVEPGDVVATLTLPYTEPSDAAKFASIHSNPPGTATDYAAAVLRTYGKGKVLWLSAPVEAADQPLHRQVFARMVRSLARAPFSFEAEASAAVEVTLFRQPDRKRYLVNLVNVQDQLPPIPVPGITVRVRTGRATAVGAVLLPGQEPLPFASSGDYTEVTIPELRTFCMAAIDYE
jgi:hypothetical protein